MSVRRILLIVLLTALGLCAAGGMLALFAATDDMVWRMVATAFATAVATGMLLPLTLLVERQRFRAGGINAMGVVLGCWVLVCLLIWIGSLSIWGLEERLLMVLGQMLLFGVPTAGALLLVSFPWARGAVYVLVVGAAVGFVLTLLGDLMPSAMFSDSRYSDALLSSGAVTGLLGTVAAMLLVNVGQGDRRYFRWPGVISCAAAYMVFVYWVWSTWDDPFWGRVVAMLIVIPTALGWANLVLMARVTTGQQWVCWGTLGAIGVAGLAAVGAVVAGTAEFELSILFRISAAAAIAAACGSLALVVLAHFNRRQPVAGAAEEYREITVICPGCTTRQQLPVGDAVCRVCSLQIQIKIIEPHCPACGYLLYRNTSDRCPECGQQIRKTVPPETRVPADLPGAAAGTR